MNLLHVVLLPATLLAASPAVSDETSAATVLETLLSQPHRTSRVAQILDSMATKQLAPFGGGIDLAKLNMLHLWDDKLGHGLLRVRVLGKRLFVRKLQGTRVRGELWSDRQLKFLEGLLSVLEAEQVEDVDFVVSLLDTPVCEFFNNGLAMPVFVFAKMPSCQDILVPDHSLMQDEYQHGAFGSQFHWSAIVGKALSRRWHEREPGIFWDGDFGKWMRKGLTKFRASLVLTDRKPEKHWNMDVYTSPSDHCSYRRSLNAQGNTWSMRLKNILLCGTAAIWYQPKRYSEYWYDALEEGKHYLGIREEAALEDLERVSQLEDRKLRLVAQQGFNQTAAILRPPSVRKYFAILLHRYAALQKFSPSAAHAKDAADFQEITRRTLSIVQGHWHALSAQHFHFHYAAPRDLSDASLQRAVDFRSLQELPCWGSVRCFLRCCRPSNRWRYDLGPPGDSGSLHPFCVRPGSDAKRTWEICCEGTASRIPQLFRLALPSQPSIKFFEDLEEILLEMDLPLSETTSLLETARDASLQAVLNHDVQRRYGQDGSAQPLELLLQHAWFHEEVLKAVCILQCNTHEGSCESNSCGDMGTLQMLYDRRQLHREAHKPAAPRLSEPLRDPAASALHVLLLLGERNDLALVSLLANRACPLRLHLVGPFGVNIALRQVAKSGVNLELQDLRGYPMVWDRVMMSRSADPKGCRLVWILERRREVATRCEKQGRETPKDLERVASEKRRVRLLDLPAAQLPG
eukprot:s2611_g10.t1